MKSSATKFLLPLIALPLLVVADTFVDIASPNSGRWTCRVDGVEVSPQHNREYTAAERALNLKLANPDASVVCEQKRTLVATLTALGKKLLSDANAAVVTVVPVPANSAPVWVPISPWPSFAQGSADTFDYNDFVTDADLDSLTITLNTGSAALPTGVSFGAGVLTYDGAGAVDTTTGHIATADDATVTTDSDAHTVQILSPLTGDGDLSNGEAWCDLNPTICVCSEPFTATDYIDGNGASSDNAVRGAEEQWDPNDTASNQCSWSDRVGAHIHTRNWNAQPSDRITPNNPTPGTAHNTAAYAASALPDRIPEFTPRFRGRPYAGPYRSTNWSGHNFTFTPSFSSSTKRREYRWYIWYPPDFIFTGGGDQNEKKWQSLIGAYWTGGPENLLHHAGTHDWSSTDAGTGECGLLRMKSRSLPGEYQQSDFKSDWWRYSIIVDNVTDGTGDPGTGNGTRIRFMAKNVTQDTAETTWIDSLATTTPSNNPNGEFINNIDWNCVGETDLWRVGEDFGKWTQNNYGQATDTSDSSNVPKWKGWAYVQVAAWTAAQCTIDALGADKWDTTSCRIGSAYEMEGAAGVIDP